MIYWGWFAENLGHIKISWDIFSLHRFQKLLVPWIGPALPVWEPDNRILQRLKAIGITCMGCTSTTRATLPQGPSLTRQGPFSSSSSGGLPRSGAAPAACPTPPACGWRWRTSSSWGCSLSLSTPSATHWEGRRDWRGGHLPEGNQVPKSWSTLIQVKPAHNECQQWWPGWTSIRLRISKSRSKERLPALQKCKGGLSLENQTWKEKG